MVRRFRAKQVLMQAVPSELGLGLLLEELPVHWFQCSRPVQKVSFSESHEYLSGYYPRDPHKCCDR